MLRVFKKVVPLHHQTATTMTIQDLTANRARIIRNIQAQMTIDAAAKQSMVKPVMNKMIAFLNREDYSTMSPTMKNIDKLTYHATTSWIKHDYNSSMTQAEIEAFQDRCEEAKRSSHSTFH